MAKSSWSVIRSDRELLVLPVLSFLAAAAVGLVAFGLVIIADYDSAAGWEEFEIGPGGAIILVVAFAAIAIVTTFFQAALISGARERLTGGDPTIGSAIGAAMSRIGLIIPWALFNFTVGMLLRAIDERAGVLGRFVVGLLSMAWNVITFLTVPIIVFEELGPFSAFRRSTELLRNTWGENLAAQIGLGLIGFIAVLPGLIVGGLLVATGTIAAVAVGVVILVMWIAAVMVVMTALTAVYQTALYEYATTGVVPQAFNSAGLDQAFDARR
ncbi:MAG: DUF6159 family protein [Acidimicrobiia bacterium]|nr:DUF6159 family protein [Acidimicrobiia bacterium]